MANEEHLKILSKGREAWIKWRGEHPEITPDLSGALLSPAHLPGLDLDGSNLSGAYLRRADLNGARLSRACLDGADLNGADLGSASLRGADLSDANLGNAILTDADLSDAILGDTNLSGAILNGTTLCGANLYHARLSGTMFGGVDLREVNGLESVRHLGPSAISLGSIHRSEGQIPEVFLRGCGLRDWEIEAAKLYRTDLSGNQIIELTYKIIELRSDPFIRFNSCFISYSGKDEAFAGCIYSDLQNSGVRCWFAAENMKIGDRIRQRIDDSILLHDKLLLILSETSISSPWIEQEVETALEKEQEEGRTVLFPIRLDDTIMSMRRGWPALIKKTRHIGDFRLWENPIEYQKVFKRLLDDLRVEA